MDKTAYRCVFYLKPEVPHTVPTKVVPCADRDEAFSHTRGRLPANVLRVDVERGVQVKGRTNHLHWRLQARRYNGQPLQEIKLV